VRHPRPRRTRHRRGTRTRDPDNSAQPHGSLTEHQDEEIGDAAAPSTLRALDDVTDRLIRHTGSRTAQQASAIASWVRETASQFEHAPIQNYVPILVENLVRNRIALTTP
jgi:hypothetical protein